MSLVAVVCHAELITLRELHPPDANDEALVRRFEATMRRLLSSAQSVNKPIVF